MKEDKQHNCQCAPTLGGHMRSPPAVANRQEPLAAQSSEEEVRDGGRGLKYDTFHPYVMIIKANL